MIHQKKSARHRDGEDGRMAGGAITLIALYPEKATYSSNLHGDRVVPQDPGWQIDKHRMPSYDGFYLQRFAHEMEASR